MRYPACLIIPIALTLTSLRAADAPVASGTTAAAPTAATASAASATVAAPASSTTATATSSLPAAKPVPVTAPIDLFNGKDLTGWQYIAAGKPADISTVAQVKDGIMAVPGVPGRGTGYLLLPEIRANYVLHFEWRWTTNNAKNNSGGLINISPGPLQQNLWPLSFQAQTKTQRAGDIIDMAGAACAEITATTPAATANRQKDASEKPSGEWNACDVTVRGDTIEYSVNGVMQNKVTKCVPSSGQIGFQLEGYPYEMRNIKLSPLPSATP